VRVNAVLPGGVATEIFHGLPEAMREAESARFASQPLPRIAEPEEVAQAYLYAMKAGYTTGQVLQVDGGSRLAG
jgi:NAD(P)-dependent dehydrogenase (short-subunit alcohol dehydrogenase family)